MCVLEKQCIVSNDLAITTAPRPMPENHVTATPGAKVHRHLPNGNRSNEGPPQENAGTCNLTHDPDLVYMARPSQFPNNASTLCTDKPTSRSNLPINAQMVLGARNGPLFT